MSTFPTDLRRSTKRRSVIDLPYIYIEPPCPLRHRSRKIYIFSANMSLFEGLKQYVENLLVKKNVPSRIAVYEFLRHKHPYNGR